MLCQNSSDRRGAGPIHSGYSCICWLADVSRFTHHRQTHFAALEGAAAAKQGHEAAEKAATKRTDLPKLQWNMKGGKGVRFGVYRAGLLQQSDGHGGRGVSDNPPVVTVDAVVQELCKPGCLHSDAMETLQKWRDEWKAEPETRDRKFAAKLDTFVDKYSSELTLMDTGRYALSKCCARLV